MLCKNHTKNDGKIYLKQFQAIVIIDDSYYPLVSGKLCNLGKNSWEFNYTISGFFMPTQRFFQI